MMDDLSSGSLSDIGIQCLFGVEDVFSKGASYSLAQDNENYPHLIFTHKKKKNSWKWLETNKYWIFLTISTFIQSGIMFPFS